MKKLVFILLLINISFAYSQNKNTKPNKSEGVNKTKFVYESNSYKFYHDDILLYEYTVIPNKSRNGGTFSVLKAYSSDGNSFLPSVGGVSALLSSKEKNPWDSDVEFLLLNHKLLNDDTVFVYWAMISNKDTCKYFYKLKIDGKALVLKVLGDTKSEKFNKATAIKLDRCEQAVNPFAIEVPYLPMFSILLANNEFTSFFADWEMTNSSELMPFQPTYYSSSSVYYSQNIIYKPKTNGFRNKLDETLYLTISGNIEDVFPNIPNPVSEFKDISENSILWDYRQPFGRLITKPWNYLQRFNKAGIKNLWVQIHEWQNDHSSTLNYLSGYDDGLPCVLPANTNYVSGNEYGGKEMLDKIIVTAKNQYGFRIGLHQNYIDIYKNADCKNYGFNQNVVALNSDGEFRKAWFNEYTKMQSFILKPSRSLSYTNYWSSGIQKLYNLNASYLDVHSSINPSEAVDYDSEIPDAGKFIATLNNYRSLYSVLRKNHNGPVQGEGGFHFLYQGYIDDVEARIRTSARWDTLYNCPLFVNFDLLKLHSKTMVHGVGFYPFFMGLKSSPPSKKYVLAYIATELAYGHGSYLPDSFSTGMNIIDHAKLEYKHVFSVQKDLADAIPLKIRYNDNGKLRTASEYIRAHPKNYNKIKSSEFMGQVFIEYDNGIKVFVNRNPHKSWEIEFGLNDGWYNYNANGKLYTGFSKMRKFNLPKVNGWLVYKPAKQK